MNEKTWAKTKSNEKKKVAIQGDQTHTSHSFKLAKTTNHWTNESLPNSFVPNYIICHSKKKPSYMKGQTSDEPGPKPNVKFACYE